MLFFLFFLKIFLLFCYVGKQCFLLHTFFYFFYFFWVRGGWGVEGLMEIHLGTKICISTYGERNNDSVILK